MLEVSVSHNGGIVIPADIRKKYGITPGTRISVVERENEIALRLQVKDLARKLCGSLKEFGSGTDELLRERARDNEREDAKFG